MLQARENLMSSIQTFLKKFNHISFRETPKVLMQAWDKLFEIQHTQPEDTQELFRKLLEDLQIINKELAEYINYLSWNCPAFYDDDDDEYSIQVSKKSPIAITPVLPTEEPDNSLSMGDKHLDTILETESNEVIKSSVEDLVPIPSDYEGILDNMCDVPFCDNSPPLDVLTDHFELFFDFDDDCTSSDGDYFEDIDYVEASPPDSELINLEEGELSGVSMEAILGEPRVYVLNVLPTSGEEISISFIYDPLYPVFDSLLPFSSKNEDKLFKPSILSYLIGTKPLLIFLRTR
nr:hypothetical protein [Tanacetum cinerariifolium]